MLKQPRSEDICRYFGENPPFLLVLFAIGIIIFFSRTFTTTYTSIACVTWNERKTRKKLLENIKIKSKSMKMGFSIKSQKINFKTILECEI